VYKMLKLKVIAHVDRLLEVTGILGAAINVSNLETAPLPRASTTRRRTPATP